MLKEICITPQVFDSEYIDSSNWKDIKSLLENIANSGYILGLKDKDWVRNVFDNISHLEQKIKDKLLTILSILKDRDRIVEHPTSDIFTISDEDDWYAVAEYLNNIRNFHKIIATQSFKGNATSIEQLEDINISDEFGITGSKRDLKTKEALKNILLPFLSYSKKVTIIDPYFYLHFSYCQRTLRIVAECLRERRGHREKGSIGIHCKWDKDIKDIRGKIKVWQQAIKNISRAFNHSIKLHAWERIDRTAIKLHDRYIITNQSGLVSAAGIGLDEWQQSEWSIKDYGELNHVLMQYKENSSPFKLKCIITTSSIEEQ
jgi:hypothetical protein